MELLARTCKAERMNLERLFARAFVAFGGTLWIAGVLGANLSYQDKALSDSAMSALVPFAIAVAALIIGWFYETLAAYLLFGGSIAAVVWGITSGWETGVWLTMGAVLIAPMAIAGLLFLLASRMQRICTLEET
jgi:hypothetical protein